MFGEDCSNSDVYSKHSNLVCSQPGASIGKIPQCRSLRRPTDIYIYRSLRGDDSHSRCIGLSTFFTPAENQRARSAVWFSFRHFVTHPVFACHLTGRMAQAQGASMLLFLVVALALSVNAVADSQLAYRFYRNSCPNVEKIVYREVKKAFNKDKTIAPGILRLIFHDCFVRGCDASVLLAGDGTERSALTNIRLHGFEVIDQIKTALEKECPNTVSCADILAYASRDTVKVTGGKGWKVPAGRRDGRVSLEVEVDQNLPPATFNAQQLISIFASKGLTPEQMVILSGSHTIGVTHCVQLRDRIFSPIDPTMPKDLLKQMQKICPLITSPASIVMDRRSVHKFDTQYFKNIASGKGIMTSDQTLYSDRSTRRFVLKNLKQSTFVHRFGKAMVAMTAIEPKVFPDGEIRKHCQFVN